MFEILDCGIIWKNISFNLANTKKSHNFAENNFDAV
jgi:hypothetical protein